ncbi:related to pyruvate dehydrogenase complex protein X precursor, dihydrolipoamide acetyltransferase component [Phialocephala subalpina]|uniref:Related to pyruvate dehydrogenase complex protein X, dihydrolipoamide acetyltransferase component n=1 Tax=Phialocephala subalpina TaxID=576137 RepID=A0A1L7XMF5_9HELO|nr:related to pyruvate dehydrogenase complex protein X precursor, dihydrolipoamide acetyltransferase component [Phialocephala subalpina]
MASFATACRLSARLTARQLRQDASARGFRTSAKVLAAQNFTMPALSPTMTEGNIGKWAVKEGDSFSAGDVLLEIETDKASMDVEAQDDGIMAKITQPDGTKGIKVGTRIGVLAEPGDDLSSLEIPAEESAAPEPKKEASKPKSEASSESSSSAPPTPSSSASSEAPAKPAGKPKKQTYPLLPSVGHLMKEHGIEESAIDKMIPSGPNGRLLKGDVLAYLGSVSSSYPSELSTKIEKLTHLDLSNIKLAVPAPKPAKAVEPAPEPIVPQETEVAVPISMRAVLDVQKRIQSTLGVFMPMSTFIARATDVANDNLPRSKTQALSADELFDQVLGLDKVTTASGVRGTFLPQITALPSAAPSVPVKPAKQLDIIDILAGGSRPSTLARKPVPGLSNSVNVFSVKVPKGDEKRAQVFLDRVKAVLEAEPGRLVL